MPERNPPRTETDPLAALNRLTLGLLDHLDNYACERQGYDPYDTSRARAPDVWSTKRKRA
jgi:hypothetical protein